MVSAIEIVEAEDKYSQDSHPKLYCELRFCYLCGSELVGRSVIPMLCRDCGNAVRREARDAEKRRALQAINSQRHVDEHQHRAYVTNCEHCYRVIKIQEGMQPYCGACSSTLGLYLNDGRNCAICGRLIEQIRAGDKFTCPACRYQAELLEDLQQTTLSAVRELPFFADVFERVVGEQSPQSDAEMDCPEFQERLAREYEWELDERAYEELWEEAEAVDEQALESEVFEVLRKPKRDADEDLRRLLDDGE